MLLGDFIYMTSGKKKFVQKIKQIRWDWEWEKCGAEGEMNIFNLCSNLVFKTDIKLYIPIYVYMCVCMHTIVSRYT